jgi:hypothetical protein
MFWLVLPCYLIYNTAMNIGKKFRICPTGSRLGFYNGGSGVNGLSIAPWLWKAGISEDSNASL